MEIIFAGDSHYGLPGFLALQEYYDTVYLPENSPDGILAARRKTDKLIPDFDAVDVPYVFLCGYGKLISQEQLDRKTYINVHGALLPKYRGMHSTFYAIMNGEKELGITFHLVNAWMDAGDILAQYAFPYTGQTVAEINAQIDALVGQYAGQVCADYMQGKIRPQKQDDAKALFGARRNLADCEIDFSMDNVLLRRFFRALTPPYPCPMLRIRGALYEVTGPAEIIDRDYFGPLGRAVYVDEKGVWIKVRDGYLIVQNVREYGTQQERPLRDLVPIGYRFTEGR